MKMSFTGKTAVITGGGSGIGRACALGLGKQGARVAIWDINGVNAASVADEVKSLGVRALAVRVDVSKLEHIETAAGRTLDDFGRLDILVNCAGIALAPKSLLDTTLEEFQRVFAINLKGVWHCAQVAARDMIKRRSGRIINIASVAGKVPRMGLGAYCISKAAVIHLTRCLAFELAQYRGITVNAVGPGPTRTNLRQNSGLPETPEQTKARLEQLLKGAPAQFRIGVPLGRIGEPEDQAAAVIFLASEEAGYISGQCLSVDGMAGEC
jgi:NAD(P)-dependent dehydrogenase (short-subunit alcohol dehydrogenase family)